MFFVFCSDFFLYYVLISLETPALRLVCWCVQERTPDPRRVKSPHDTSKKKRNQTDVRTENWKCSSV